MLLLPSGYDIAKIHLHQCTLPSLICLDSCIIFHCAAASQCIHPSPTDGHLGCFQASAAVNRKAVNILVQVSWGPGTGASLQNTSRQETGWATGAVDGEL